MAVFREAFHQLAVYQLWPLLRSRFHPVDVYHQALSVQHGLSDGEPELRDGYVCSYHLLPRTDTYDQMDRGIPDHVWMCADCKMIED